MLLKSLFHLFFKNDPYMKKVSDKLSELENKVKCLEEIEIKTKKESLQPPVIIEKLSIDRLIVEKFELNNNFGQLGVKELKGTMNIGATYGDWDPFSFKNYFEDENENNASFKKTSSACNKKGQQNTMDEGKMKVNIKARKT